jgi:signal transduction histidine kinase
VRDRESDDNLRGGRVERATGRLYARLGSKVAVACVACAAATGVVTGVIMLAVGFRYLRLSAADAWSTFAVWMPVLLALLALGVWTCRDDIRKILRWSPGSGRESAVESWYVVGGSLTRIVSRVALFAFPGIVCAALYVVIRFDRPWYDVLVLGVGATVALLADWVLVLFASELACGPMLREIAAELPLEFEPQRHGMPLRTRALLPLPIVTFFAAMTVGAYTDITRNPDARLAFAVGVSFATVAVATLVFLIVNRSVLAPIDDLIAATERVRHGDIRTPVPLTSADELGQLTTSFNEMLADLRRNTEELRASRERIVAAADEERRRVERDLHDGAQQQLVLARLKLGRLSVDPGHQSAVDEVRGDLDRALSALRDLAHGLYPQTLASDGLPGALEEAARGAAIPTTVDCDGAGRYRRELEAAVYFCCLEALQNAAKHAGEGAQATVSLAQRDNTLEFSVADDGSGFNPAAAGASTGLQNMADRIGALGGTLTIDGATGKGTRVMGEVPLGGTG